MQYTHTSNQTKKPSSHRLTKNRPLSSLWYQSKPYTKRSLYLLIGSLSVCAISLLTGVVIDSSEKVVANTVAATSGVYSGISCIATLLDASRRSKKHRERSGKNYLQQEDFSANTTPHMASLPQTTPLKTAVITAVPSIEAAQHNSRDEIEDWDLSTLVVPEPVIMLPDEFKQFPNGFHEADEAVLNTIGRNLIKTRVFISDELQQAISTIPSFLTGRETALSRQEDVIVMAGYSLESVPVKVGQVFKFGAVLPVREDDPEMIGYNLSGVVHKSHGEAVLLLTGRHRNAVPDYKLPLPI